MKKFYFFSFAFLLFINISRAQDFYIENWGFNSPSGDWIMTPGDSAGSVTVSGADPESLIIGIRGAFNEPFELSEDTALVVSGKFELVEGGFEDRGDFALGLYYSESAGTLDSTDKGFRWSGTNTGTFGYLFIPHSRDNNLIFWRGIPGTVGAVVNGRWYSTGDTGSYVLSTSLQEPEEAYGSEGFYQFIFSFISLNDGSTDIRYYIAKDDGSYYFRGKIIDDHDPLVTKVFNSFNILLHYASAVRMNLSEARVQLGSPLQGDPVAIETEENINPNQYALNQNYPNPFNPNTRINYSLTQDGIVELKIYDVLGKEITTLVNEHQLKGSYSVEFDAGNLASGVYIYKIKVNDFVASKKMILSK